MTNAWGPRRAALKFQPLAIGHMGQNGRRRQRATKTPRYSHATRTTLNIGKSLASAKPPAK
eukprot:6697197-Alexandrium_andersonii.AAC.1